MAKNVRNKEMNEKINKILQKLYKDIELDIKKNFEKTSFKTYKDVVNWKGIILTLIKQRFDNVIKGINKKDKDTIEEEDMNKKVQSISNDYNVITSKDIQNEYSKIIDNFKIFSGNNFFELFF